MNEQLKFQQGLSKEQIDFLQKHKIHPRYVFDGKGMKKAQYRPIMKELNKGIVFNVSPCKKGGHTLYTRTGHCCQCSTAPIAFLRRNDSEGVVYIAGTIEGQSIKVGFTKAVAVRYESLNRTKYAGFKDWEMLFAISSPDAGRIETKTNVLLQTYEFSIPYIHDGHWQDAFETFKCSLSKAKELINEVCTASGYTFVELLNNGHSSKYEFKNLVKANTKTS